VKNGIQPAGKQSTHALFIQIIFQKQIKILIISMIKGIKIIPVGSQKLLIISGLFLFSITESQLLSNFSLPYNE